MTGYETFQKAMIGIKREGLGRGGHAKLVHAIIHVLEAFWWEKNSLGFMLEFFFGVQQISRLSDRSVHAATNSRRFEFFAS